MRGMTRRSRILLWSLALEAVVVGAVAYGWLRSDDDPSRPRQGEITRPQLPLIAKLTVRDRTPRAGHPLASAAPDAFASAVRIGLQRQRGFEVPDADEPIDEGNDRRTYRVAIDLALTLVRPALPIGDVAGEARVTVSMEMERVSGGRGLEAYAREMLLERLAPASGSAGARPFWDALIADAVSATIQAIAREFHARHKTSDELFSDLRSEDIAIKVAAIQQLGRMRPKGAVDALAPLLADNHQDVVLKALGALTNLRDPRSASALISSTRGRSSEYVFHVVAALQTIGGVEAEAFLDSIAVGHTDAAVRQQAEEALTRLRHRPGAGR